MIKACAGADDFPGLGSVNHESGCGHMQAMEALLHEW